MRIISLKWRKKVIPKRCNLSTKLHGITPCKTIIGYPDIQNSTMKINAACSNETVLPTSIYQTTRCHPRKRRRFYLLLPQSLQTNLKISHEPFFPWPPQFTIHNHPPIIRRLICSVYKATSHPFRSHFASCRLAHLNGPSCLLLQRPVSADSN
jgi:hypothetical protein